MVLKAYRFMCFRVEAHFNVYRFAFCGFTGNVETQVPLPGIVNGRFVGDDGLHRYCAPYKRGNEVGESAS